jgi:hypothetical protein
LIVAIAAQVVLAMLTFVISDLVEEVAIRLIATLLLLLYVRLVIHQSLLVEGAEHEIGPDAPCPECHRIVPTMAFCPSCGAARAADRHHRSADCDPGDRDGGLDGFRGVAIHWREPLDLHRKLRSQDHHASP